MRANVFDPSDDCSDWAVSGENRLLVNGLCSNSILLVRDVERCSGAVGV